MTVIFSGLISLLVYITTFKMEVDTENKTKAFVILGVLVILTLIGVLNN